MKALVLKEIGTLVVEDRADPIVAADEVLIRVHSTGICGSDVHGFSGETGRRVPGQVMGHESSGVIEALGGDVTGLNVGDPVTFNPVVVRADLVDEYRGSEQHSPESYVIGVRTDIDASFAELISVPARNVVTLPASMPLEHGALIEPLAVALHAIDRLQPEPGSRVFVTGGGPIGQSVVLALKIAGVTDVIVSEVDPARNALIERLGARTINPTTGPVVETVASMFGGLADAAVDAVGITPTIADCLTVTRTGARIVLVGMGARQVDLSAYKISTEERTLVGSFTYSAHAFERAAAWLATVPDIAEELISERVDMAGAPDAFRRLAASAAVPGKILVRIG